MVELYVAATPEVEASGASILSVIGGAGSVVKPLLTKHGLDDVKPNEWYPQQKWLDFFRDLAESRGNMANLVAIGMSIPETASFPPEIDSVEGALQMLNVAYHMNNRNDPVENRWEYEKVAEDEYHVTCRTAVSRDFEYGVVYGLVKRFCAEGVDFVVYRDPQPDGSAIFKVKLSKRPK